ncbi:hypothetical protein PHLGIDRAFT_148860 [Phlebiopsis gigantea 11061_1 CR5-6]|uniref:F-box domain-containing protein n=1 Tax=Phlebiopsis gigantea (strain 11061_1 CR5-6) TaxID=745531 RepID=A0A0C3S8P6_PHLG1|nr:hypothetical protein PHLGIDRAFT_148860 [Phlebiopsis gigantea 11061_1 CR5-6]
MHPCLTVDEILTIIMQNLASPYSHEDDQRVFTNVALVCKTFCGPAMSESWRIVEDLSRLVHTFPPGVVAFEQPLPYEDPASYKWSLRRPPTSREWARFDLYARKIRKLHWRTPLAGEVPQVEGLHLLEAMRMHYGNAPVFQCLRSLELDIRSDATARYWSLFMQPAMCSLVGVCTSWDARNEPTCASQYLQMVYHTGLRSIKEVHLDASVVVGDCAGLWALSELRHLRKLHATIAIQNITPQREEVLFARQHIAFSSLEDLALCVVASRSHTEDNNVAIPEKILRLVSSRFLKNFSLTWCGRVPTVLRLYELLCAITRFRHTLLTCSLRIRPQILMTSDVAIALDELLPPLRMFGRVLTVFDCATLPMHLDSPALNALLAVLPNVRELSLGVEHPYTVSHVPLVALAVVRARAPHLEQLGLRIALPPGPLPRFLAGAPQEVLRELDLGTPEGLGEDLVAYNFVKMCFPRVDAAFL